MVVTTPARERTTKIARRFGVAVLASCVGAGTLLAASPAMALDGFDTKSIPQNSALSLTKSDSVTGAPLSGTVYEAVVTIDPKFYIGAFGAYDSIDPSMWTFASPADHAPLTWEEYRDARIAEHNSAIEPNLAAYNALVTERAGLDPVAAQAAIDAYDAAVAAAAPARATYEAADAAETAHEEEMLALEALGGARTPEQTDRLAVLMGTLAEVRQTTADAFAIYQPLAQTVSDLSAANAAGINTLDRIPVLDAEIAAYGDMALWTADANGVDRADFDTRSAAWHAVNAPRVANAIAQQDCNEAWGVPTTPTDLGGGRYSYMIATCDGVGYFPLNATPSSIQEVKASDGYALDSTVYEITPANERDINFKGERVNRFTGVLPFTNDPLPPVEPPVDPPVEPPVEPPVTPPTTPPVEQPKTPETELAYTGSDTNVGALAGIAGLLAGAGILAFRRRTASE